MADTETFKKLPREKQDRIFDSAVQEFAEKGFQTASMNTVVQSAGISKGSLFQYFQTKLDLFDTVVNLATTQVKNHLRAARDKSRSDPLDTRVATLLHSGFDFIDTYPLLARIYFGLLQSGKSPLGSRKLSELHKQSISFLTGLLNQARENGELRENLDTERTAFLLNGMMQQLLHAYYTEHVDAGLGLYHGNRKALEDWVRATVELTCCGVLKDREKSGAYDETN
jgi:TetR/AcrR family transcriptional regulator